MKFILNINSDNDRSKNFDFDDAVKLILKEVAASIDENNPRTGVVNDITDAHGNTIGAWMFDDKKHFTLFWLSGDRQVIDAEPGMKFEDAATAAGYGGGAMRALDFYAAGDSHDYEYDKKQRQWVSKVPVIAIPTA